MSEGATIAETITGGCACGAVRYSHPGPVKFALRCACRSCQRDTGTGHGVHVGLSRDALVTTGATATYTRLGRSGKDVVKVFCPACGCPLYGRPGRAPGIVMVMAGSLDTSEGIAPQKTIFPNEAPVWDLLVAHHSPSPPEAEDI